MLRKYGSRYLSVIGYSVLAIFTVGSLVIFLKLGDSERIKELVVRLGYFGPLVLILYFVAGHIIAPLAGSPGLFAGFVLYGARVVIFLYIAGLISAVINFYISRKFGRIWVERLGGQKALKHIDRIVERLGTELLIFSRLFGGIFWEVISYAAGFTNISFKRYFSITAIFGGIPHAVLWYFFSKTVSSPEVMVIFAVTMVVVGIVFGLITNWVLKKK
jgi:uncharacterized membrane protein YdjX (TVP38/TMEM64 family)